MAAVATPLLEQSDCRYVGQDFHAYICSVMKKFWSHPRLSPAEWRGPITCLSKVCQILAAVPLTLLNTSLLHCKRQNLWLKFPLQCYRLLTCVPQYQLVMSGGRTLPDRLTLGENNIIKEMAFSASAENLNSAASQKCFTDQEQD